MACREGAYTWIRGQWRVGRGIYLEPDHLGAKAVRVKRGRGGEFAAGGRIPGRISSGAFRWRCCPRSERRLDTSRSPRTDPTEPIDPPGAVGDRNAINIP
eukprot:29347-Prorocentrum_minimum.AAC.1